MPLPPDIREVLDKAHQAGQISDAQYQKKLGQIGGQPQAAPSTGTSAQGSMVPDWLKEFGKDEMYGSAVNMLNPFVGGTPLIATPAKRMLRAAVEGTSIPDAALEGLKSGAVETGVGLAFAGAGKVAGKVMGPITRGLGALIDSDASAKMLTKYFRAIANRGGDPKLQEEVASKLYNRALELGGDALVPVEHSIKFTKELAEEGGGALSGGISAPVQKILDDVAAVQSKATNAGTVTLKQIHHDLKRFGQRISDLRESDPEGARLATSAFDAAIKDLKAATGDSGVGEAAETLLKGRAVTKKIKDAADLNKLITKAGDPATEGLISTRKMATANREEKIKMVESWLKDDPKALAAWHQGLKAVRATLKPSGPWFPEPMRIKGIEKVVGRVLKHGNVKRILGDPKISGDFFKLVQPGGITDPKVMMATAYKILHHLGEPMFDEDTQNGEK